jgi:hypothetical protein
MSLYCDDPVPAYVEDLCAKEQSRVTAIALIRTDNTTLSTYTSSSEWTNGVSDGTIIIIKNVRGDKPKSSRISTAGFGLQKEFSVGRDFTLNYSHPDVVGNEDFYNALNYNNSYQLAYHTAGGKIWIAGDAVVNIDADHVVVEDLNNIIVWNNTVTWSAQDIPVAYTAPAGVFDV